jgi:hypothetical protein
MNIGFLGGSYNGRSITDDGQETMNWYPEISEEPTGNSDDGDKLVLYPTPGLKLFITV